MSTPALLDGADDLQAVAAVIAKYADGLHHADVAALRGIFDEHARLQAPGLRRSREDWLAAVASRPIPAQRGDPYAYRVLAIDILGDQAMAKVDCPLLGRRYIDYLGLLKEDGRWCIVNKMYADHPADAASPTTAQPA